MYSGEYDACDVTLSVYPHWAFQRSIPTQSWITAGKNLVTPHVCVVALAALCFGVDLHQWNQIFCLFSEPTCPLLPTVPFADIEYSSKLFNYYPLGTTAEYSCRGGSHDYNVRLKRLYTRECKGNGWSGKEPQKYICCKFHLCVHIILLQYSTYDMTWPGC